MPHEAKSHEATSADLSQPPTPDLDGPRAPRLDERAALIEMINFVFRIAQGRAPTIDRDWAHIYAPENLANVAVICDPAREAVTQPQSASVAGQVVASTGVWVNEVTMGDYTLRVGGINCVGTLPEYRRLGLGAEVMRAAHQTLRDRGCHVGLLSTGITNWYRRMGWENAGVMRSYALNRGNIQLLPSLRPEVQVRRVVVAAGDVLAADVAAAAMALYASARLGAARKVATWQQRVAARGMAQLFLAEAAGQLVAYALVHEHTVTEWAGAAADVLGLVRAIFAEFDDPTLSTSQRGRDGSAPSLRTLTLETPGPIRRGAVEPHPLLTWLDALGVPFQSDYLGMLYVVDPQGVLDAFGLDDVEVASQPAAEGREQFVVRVAGATLTLDRGELVKLFFGPERMMPARTNEVADSPFPLPFWQWSLDMV